MNFRGHKVICVTFTALDVVFTNFTFIKLTFTGLFHNNNNKKQIHSLNIVFNVKFHRSNDRMLVSLMFTLTKFSVTFIMFSQAALVDHCENRFLIFRFRFNRTFL